jgi:hypothetical protein
MPPKKRARTATASATTTATPAEVSRANRPRLSQNTSSGLLAMPVELLHLIAKFFGCRVEVPFDAPRCDDPHLPLQYSERSDCLRVLSQTCHQLRLAFLPLLWECLNICVKSGKGGAFYKVLGDLLKRTSEGLAGEPELLAHIRSDSGYIPYQQSLNLNWGQDSQCDTHPILFRRSPTAFCAMLDSDAEHAHPTGHHPFRQPILLLRPLIQFMLSRSSMPIVR